MRYFHQAHFASLRLIFIAWAYLNTLLFPNGLAINITETTTLEGMTISRWRDVVGSDLYVYIVTYMRVIIDGVALVNWIY
jgi:hypothetical protein